MKTLTLVTASVLALATASAFADERIRTRMTGYQEVPSVSTAAGGEFEVKIHPDGQAFDWVLSYSGLQGDVLQAHIHFAQRSVIGAIVVWLCGSATNPGPAGTPACPQSGTVSGTAMAGNVGPGASRKSSQPCVPAWLTRTSIPTSRRAARSAARSAGAVAATADMSG
jgi:hypothetical protein